MPTPKIILLANTAWNLWNYRLALIKTLEQMGYAVVLAAPEDRFRLRLEADTRARFIPLIHLSRRSFSLLQNWRCLWELFRLFRGERPAAVLLYTMKPNILGNLAARLAGTPAISIVEGLGYSGSTAARWRWWAAPLYRLAFRASRFCIFLNASDESEFRRLHLVTEAQARVIPGPGIDTDHFKPLPAPMRDQIIFLFSGRLLREKGILEFVEAARLILNGGYHATFEILGAPDAGNPTTLDTREIDKWKMEGLVRYLGRVDDVRSALANADVLVLPSFYREGVPRSVLEAMSMEKIIITTNTPGCQDTVEEGRNGFLIPPLDVNALAGAMVRILRLSPDERQRMGAFSRQKALRQFSNQVVLPQLLALLESVARRPTSTRTAQPPFPR